MTSEEIGNGDRAGHSAKSGVANSGLSRTARLEVLERLVDRSLGVAAGVAKLISRLAEVHSAFVSVEDLHLAANHHRFLPGETADELHHGAHREEQVLRRAGRHLDLRVALLRQLDESPVADRSLGRQDVALPSPALLEWVPL